MVKLFFILYCFILGIMFMDIDGTIYLTRFGSSLKVQRFMKACAPIGSYIFVMVLTFSFLHAVLNTFCNVNISAYFSLTITLILNLYRPDRLWLWPLRVCLTPLFIFIYAANLYFSEKVSLEKKTSVYHLSVKDAVRKINDDFDRDTKIAREFINELHPKSWGYYISLLLTLISTFETLGQITIISDPFWMENKSVIMESVITFIVLDRLIKEIKT